VTIWAAIATGCAEGAVGEDGIGEGAVTRAGFTVLCGAGGCGFEEGSARVAAGAMAVFEVVAGVVGDALDDASDVVSDPVSKVVSNVVVGSTTDVGSEDVVTRIAAELVPDLASDLLADFEFRFNELRFGLELTPRLAAALARDLDSTLASDFETNSVPVFSPRFVPSLASGLELLFAAISDTAD
jgi:hypothetical protein